MDFQRRDGSDDTDEFILCILFRIDVIGCGIWTYYIPCMFYPASEVPEDGRWHEEVTDII